MAGGRTGKYGVKGSAEALLPPAPDRRGTPVGAWLSMSWLPLAASLVAAALLAPTMLERLERAGVVRANYRGLVCRRRPGR